MLQNLCKTLGFMKNMVYKIPLGEGGGGKPYPASGLYSDLARDYVAVKAQKPISPHGGRLTYAIHNRRETIQSN